jgi:hypothetical protein
MKRIFPLLVLLTAIFMASVHPVFAQGGPVDVYVDPARSGANEDGTQTNPYNSDKEGKAYAQSLPNGGWLYHKDASGKWVKTTYVPPVKSGQTGDPIPNVVLYALLGILALVLVIAGQYFLRQSRQVQI